MTGGVRGLCSPARQLLLVILYKAETHAKPYLLHNEEFIGKTENVDQEYFIRAYVQRRELEDANT